MSKEEIDLKKFDVHAEFNGSNKRAEIKVFEKNNGHEEKLIGMIYRTMSDYGNSKNLCWKVYGDDSSVNYYDTKEAVLCVIALDQKMKEEVRSLKKAMGH